MGILSLRVRDCHKQVAHFLVLKITERKLSLRYIFICLIEPYVMLLSCAVLSELPR